MTDERMQLRPEKFLITAWVINLTLSLLAHLNSVKDLQQALTSTNTSLTLTDTLPLRKGAYAGLKKIREQKQLEQKQNIIEWCEREKYTESVVFENSKIQIYSII